MADADASNIFAFLELWKTPKWLESSHNGSEFFSLDIKTADESSTTPLVPNTACLDAVSDEFFRLPAALKPLDIFRNIKAQDVTELDLEPKAKEHAVDFFSDAWVLKEESPSYGAEFKTWDGFTMPDIPSAPALFMTEAGPITYDEVLRSAEDPLKISNTGHKVIEADYITASLLALALGRASVFFTWHEEKASFVVELEKMRISGYSADVLHGLQDLCFQCGNISRFLAAFVQTTYDTSTTPAKVALAKAIDSVLVVIQTKLGSQARTIKSLLRLQSMIQPVHSVLTYFKKLIANLKEARTDEHLLSILFEQTQALEHGDELLSDVMREVLTRVSQPWADFSQEWMGLKPESGIRITKDNPGKSFVKVENVALMDDFGLETEEPDYVMDQDRMPRFVPEDISRKMFETGRNLRLLRTHHPEHPLCHVEQHRSSTPPVFKWHYDWDSILQLEKEVDEYEASLSRALCHQPREPDRQFHVATGQKASYVGYELKLFGRKENELAEQLLASMKLFSQPLPAINDEDRLSRLLHDRLLEGRQRTEKIGVAFTPHWSLLPLVSFGPLVEAQARLINKEYMKLLFSAHNLRDHITLQRDFQLLGNGFFSSRLSHSLFDSGLETAERRAGVARTGGAMGLRLGGRDSWPPASSELRLALMGVLTESYLPQSSHRSLKTSSEESLDLPGNLSFAVRDLSDEEIDRCMDPGSLEALDFLRLSYKPPAPLAPVITPVILVKYDRIFKTLLRVLRMLYVSGELFRDTNSRTSSWQNINNTSLRFIIEAHHFVSTVATYFFTTGIGLPWTRFENWLDKVQSNLETKDSETKSACVISPDELREYHEHVLDEIMHMLLLRKRQQPVLKLLEDVFSLILIFSKRTRLEAQGKSEGDFGTTSQKKLYDAFKKKVGVFITVCRGLSERVGHGTKQSRNETTNDERRAGDESIIERLLLHFEMSGYYGGLRT